MTEQQQTSTETATRFQDIAFRKMTRLILVYTFLPCAIVAWIATKSWAVVVLSFGFMPLCVLIQCSVSLLTYRLYYADSPAPLTPRHGVVVVHPNDKKCSCPPEQEQSSGKGSQETGGVASVAAAEEEIKYETILNKAEMKLLNEAAKHRPLRLLLIGDSLAIGVGQTHWPTPIMPETIAKTLSKKMGGRAVYWTCHGATGASLGWVIRELERGVEYLEKKDDDGNNSNNNEKDYDTEEESVSSQSESDTGDSSSDESSLDDNSDSDRGRKTAATTTRRRNRVSDGMVQGEHNIAAGEWRRRLRKHRERFEPDLQGFYDIAVVFTGPNDLKTTVMPFLATGEDSQFRKQASFGRDLHLLLEILRRKMMETIQIQMTAPFSSNNSSQQRIAISETETETNSQHNNCSSSPKQNRCGNGNEDIYESERQGHHGQQNPQHPLVVLPGMPARMLPCFQHEPIKWYAPAAVDIMDMHKRDVANALPKDILYVPAPTTSEMTDYVLAKGPNHELKKQEDTVLSLRDIPRRESQSQQQKMTSYYNRMGKSAYLNNPFKTIRTYLFGVPPPVHLKAFAVDGIHPNELGYDFWGRYLGTAIFEEWQKRESTKVG